MYQVYSIKNKINGKYYIGVHKGDIFENNYYGSGIAINSAIEKYGKENLDRSIISTVESKKLAYFIERTIVGPKVVKDKTSYNIRVGGHGGSNKGRKFSDSYRQKMSKLNTGKGNPFYGKSHTKETKEKLRRINLGSKDSEETLRRKSEAQKGKHRESTSKLTEDEVIEIRALYETGKYTYEDLGPMFDTHPGNIGSIIREDTWRHLL